MKSICCIMTIGVVSLLMGCASTQVSLPPVGPNPERAGTKSSTGDLQVFSSLVGRAEGENPTWHQHSDYYIYDPGGNLVKHVNNTTGYYARAPRPVSLPAGSYLVKAQSTDYFWVEVPVTIQHGKTTRVHLDDNWKAPAVTPTGEIVHLPNGNPVGWSAEPANAFVMK